MPSWIPINWSLVGNPFNWVVVLLMMVIATIAISLVIGPKSSNSEGVT